MQSVPWEIRMLSRMLSEAIESVVDEMSLEELDSFLEWALNEHADLAELFEGGWDMEEALEHLGLLTELKAKAPGRKGKKNKGNSKNLLKGNPDNNPWSDYGAKGHPDAKGTGGTTMHNVLGKGGRSRTGDWQCRCKNYTCDCRNIRTGFTKTFDIKKSRHLAYNRRYKKHPHPRKDHPNSV